MGIEQGNILYLAFYQVLGKYEVYLSWWRGINAIDFWAWIEIAGLYAIYIES